MGYSEIEEKPEDITKQKNCLIEVYGLRLYYKGDSILRCSEEQIKRFKREYERGR